MRRDCSVRLYLSIKESDYLKSCGGGFVNSEMGNRNPQNTSPSQKPHRRLYACGGGSTKKGCFGGFLFPISEL